MSAETDGTHGTHGTDVPERRMTATEALESRAVLYAAVPPESFLGERVMQAVLRSLPGAKVIRLAKTARGKWLMILGMDACAPADGSAEKPWVVVWTWFGDEIVRVFETEDAQAAKNQFYALAQVSRAQCVFFEEVPA